jgi:hypothetical protein
MAERIHYEDDLFFLNTYIKGLKDGFTLDIDPDFYLDKVVEDIFFIDATLDRIFSSLRENVHLIKRSEYLRSLMRTKQAFEAFLSDVVEGKLPFAEHLEPFLPRLRASLNEHGNDVAEIHAMLKQLGYSFPEHQDMISEEEFRHLLSGDEESAEA